MPKSKILAFVAIFLMPALSSAQVDFSRDVLPILSDKCFHCHGPDEAGRKGKLRLDTKEGAFRTRNGITSIVPGNSKESELIRRIETKDHDEIMPPIDSKRTLTPQQIETLKKWVDSGAKWNRHWAFEPIKVPDPKSGKQTIDSLIRKQLVKEGLKPAPPTTKESWLRRVTFDLTGLPPTLAEYDAFAKDSSPQAYEKVVDRLLASTRYGERMAADWLDVARFADTHGYQMDRDRPVWPYRDWVIAAFNRNQRYDQFVTDQLAGDLLPNSTKKQKLATAFNRLHMQNEEGGVVEEEFRVAYVVDRVTTFGTAFLGLTFECSRCHDHKYDPLSQRDFYSLFAFFQNIDESGQTSYFTAATPVPALLLSTDEQDKKRDQLWDLVSQKEAKYHELSKSAREDFAKWTKPKEMTLPGLVAHFPFDKLEKNQTPNLVDAKHPGNGSDSPKLTKGKFGQAVELTGENGFNFSGVGHFTKTDPFSISLWLKPADHAPRAVVLHHSRAPIDAGSRGYELLLESGHVAFGMHYMWPGNSLKVQTKKVVPINEWTLVTITYDGSSRAEGTAVYLNGERQRVNVIQNQLTKDITYGGSEPDLALGNRFRDNGFKNGTVDDLRVYNRCLTAIEAKSLAGIESGKQEDEWFDYYRSTIHEPSKKAYEELRTARKELTAFVNPIPEIMAMRETAKPKPAYILKRGQYDSLGERVTANTPHELPPFPSNQPRNRLGLAKWLMQPDNPLFARVSVNRLWQKMFGTGIVETSDNFGTQGSGPSNLELLDWLAVDFMQSGWDIKHMLKEMALSETYRQSSQPSPEALAKDPNNVYLARYPVRRLSAEMIRDQMLAVSGLLVEKIGGPSVKPYQPDGLWDLSMGKPHYDRSKGDDLYRRSLYTYVKRTVPHPQQMTFDAADRSNCSVRRQSTSTPLQALALLNDIQFTETARMLAEKCLKEKDATDQARINTAFRLLTGRTADQRELAVLEKLLKSQKETFTKEPKRAEKLLAVGERKADAKLPPVDLAAMTMVCLTLQNYDEAVNRR